MEFENFLKRTVSALTEANLKYIIVGGFAAIYRGKPRTTLDLDIIIENNLNKINKFFELLKTNNFDVMDEQIAFALKERTNISIFDNESILRIDLKIARNPEEIATLNGAQDEKYKELNLKMASVEQILWGKILYMGNILEIPESELLDSNDVLDFIYVFQQAKKIDMDWLRSKVEFKGLDKILDKLVNLIDKLKNK